MLEAEDTSRLRRVLVVEDEQRLRDVLLRAIPQMDFHAQGARTAEQALELMQADPPAIVILDLNLPGMSGMELLEVIRRRWPGTAAIILTGFGDLEAARQAIRLDVTDFLTKPCSLGELEKALDRARRRLHEASIQAMREQSRTEDVVAKAPGDAGTARADQDALEAPRRLEEIERQHILAALERHAGNRATTADELGISLRTLYYRLSEYQKQGYIP
ncbi:MAG: response regulator [Phycisphaeraceae bacterium]